GRLRRSRAPLSRAAAWRNRSAWGPQKSAWDWELQFAKKSYATGRTTFLLTRCASEGCNRLDEVPSLARRVSIRRPTTSCGRGYRNKRPVWLATPAGVENGVEYGRRFGLQSAFFNLSF